MLTASIVTYHTSANELKQCFSSLVSSGLVSRLYVVDNGQENRIRSLAETAPLPVTYLALPNPGYGAAHNKAMRMATDSGADYHLILNTDVIFGPEVLPALVEYLECNDDVAMVQPLIVNPEGHTEPTARMLPTPFDLILRRFLPASWFAIRRQRYLLSHIDHSQPFNAPYLEGSFMLVRMSAANAVKGFDERFFMYPEDIDFTRRLHRRWRTMFCPTVRVTHHHRRESYRSLRMLGIHCINMIRYFNKWGWLFDKERTVFNAPFK